MVATVDVLTVTNTSTDDAKVEPTTRAFSFRNLFNYSYENVVNLIYDSQSNSQENELNEYITFTAKNYKNLTPSQSSANIIDATSQSSATLPSQTIATQSCVTLNASQNLKKRKTHKKNDSKAEKQIDSQNVEKLNSEKQNSSVEVAPKGHSLLKRVESKSQLKRVDSKSQLKRVNSKSQLKRVESKSKLRSNNVNWSDQKIEDILPQYDEEDHVKREAKKFLGFVPVPNWGWLNDHEFSVPAKAYPIRRRKDSGSRKNRIHLHADSLFSSTSGFTDYSGFFNLCMILLILSNLRVALENIIKYGILIQPLSWLQYMIKEPYSWPSFVLFLCCNTFILVTFWVERALAKDLISEKLGMIVHIVNLAAEISFPAAVVWIRHPFPIFSSVTLTVYVVIFLKLISYIQVNAWCRQALLNVSRRRFRSRNKSYSAALNTYAEEWENNENALNGKSNGYLEKLEVNKYPKNLTFTDLYYFMVVPTLCYELHFPRSARIRKRFLLRRFAEMIFLAALIGGLVQQWILPTVNNSMVPFKEMDIGRIFERLLKLAIPNHIIWLIFFYCFFHSILNVVGEITLFGDRTFYQDWWNATTVEGFWQLWNIPVHKWAVRHLYKPMLANKFSKKHATVAVFILSAFFHEYLVSIPLRMFRIWAFSAMLSQVPMAWITRKYLPGRYGNIAVWFSLIIGQPIALLMYYHDYFLINKTVGSV